MKDKKNNRAQKNAIKFEPQIGIDLGTTNSCVALFNAANQTVEVLSNKKGQPVTPSWVAFVGDKSIVGEAAASQKHYYAQVKRIMGKTYDVFDKAENKALLQSLPFEVVKGQRGRVEIKSFETGENLLPQEISSHVLSEMKAIAERRCGRKVTNAVITVPAYFNASERQATQEAAKIAGLQVMRIINEPTAAAMATGLYEVGQNGEDGKSILAFDFGGGTFDVSLISASDGVLNVEGTHGDMRLGGVDLDEVIVKMCINHIKETIQVREGAEAPESLPIELINSCKSRLVRSCQRAKENLSAEFVTTIRVDQVVADHEIYQDLDFELEVSRADFEEQSHEIFARLEEPITKALEAAQMSMDDVEEIVLVGGSSRIPYVKEWLKTFSGKDTLNESLNPDEAVAIGAATMAGIMSAQLGEPNFVDPVSQPKPKTGDESVEGSDGEYPVPDMEKDHQNERSDGEYTEPDVEKDHQNDRGDDLPKPDIKKNNESESRAVKDESQLPKKRVKDESQYPKKRVKDESQYPKKRVKDESQFPKKRVKDESQFPKKRVKDESQFPKKRVKDESQFPKKRVKDESQYPKKRVKDESQFPQKSQKPNSIPVPVPEGSDGEYPEPEDNALNNDHNDPPRNDASSDSDLPQPDNDSSNSDLPEPDDDSSNSDLPEPDDDSSNSDLPEPDDDSSNSDLPEPDDDSNDADSDVQPESDSNNEEPIVKVVNIPKQKVVVSDVVPLSIGVEKREKGGGKRRIMDTLIKAGSAMPITLTKKYQTSIDNQPEIKITVIQGQKELAADNHKLGQFTLTGIPCRPKGEIKLVINLQITADGTLAVTGSAQGNDSDSVITEELTVNALSSTMTQEEIEEARSKHKQFR